MSAVAGAVLSWGFRVLVSREVHSSMGVMGILTRAPREESTRTLSFIMSFGAGF